MRTKGIKSRIAPRTMHPRVSRHGKLLAEVFVEPVPAVTQRKVIFNEAKNEYVTEIVVVKPASVRASTAAEIANRRDRVLRATSPTVEGYKKNDGGSGAGKKKVKG